MQCVHDSTTKLTVIQPGNVNFGISFLVVALLSTIIWVLVALFVNIEKGKISLLLFMMLFIATFYFITYECFTSGGTAVLLKDQNTLTMQQSGKTETYPLRSVQQAIVQTADGGSLRMVFVMNDGQVVLMGDGSWAPRGGAYAAADAVNSFLHSGSIESTPTTPSASAPEDLDWQKEMKKKSDLQEKDYQERLRKEQAAKE
jgi:hypothetical protein